MIDTDNQQIAANYMAAVAHLFGGQPGRLEDFLKKVELVLCGSAPQEAQLAIFCESVRHTGRPVIWILDEQDDTNVPIIGIVVMVGDQPVIFADCMLVLSAKADRASIVTNVFKRGAFRFDDDLQLRYIPKATARSYRHSPAAFVRAYVRLSEIEITQRKRGDIFPLPQFAKAA